MNAEQWAPVTGWEGLYEVSTQGRVRSSRGLRHLSLNAYGYPRLELKARPRKETALVHRLVLEAFVGPCPEGMEACHADGDRANSVLSNLRWDTPSANTLDKVAQGNHLWANKTHCPQNHPYDESNTYRNAGRRHCRACANDRGRAYRARHQSERKAS